MQDTDLDGVGCLRETRSGQTQGGNGTQGDPPQDSTVT